MKLSDAILLGSVVLKPKRGMTVDRGYGCAMGMALVAEGTLRTDDMVITSIMANSIWPWLGKASGGGAPCGCDRYRDETYRGTITHLFDTCHWPAERIAAWVATVEPPAEETQELGRDPAESTADELVLSK